MCFDFVATAAHGARRQDQRCNHGALKAYTNHDTICVDDGVSRDRCSNHARRRGPVPAAAQPNTVRYRPAEKDLKFVYATAPPVATLEPGDILETNTVDAFGNVIKKPGDTMAMVKGDNPLTGPFAIDGAEPGDTLVVKFLELTVGFDQGRGRARARASAR